MYYMRTTGIAGIECLNLLADLYIKKKKKKKKEKSVINYIGQPYTKDLCKSI